MLPLASSRLEVSRLGLAAEDRSGWSQKRAPFVPPSAADRLRDRKHASLLGEGPTGKEGSEEEDKAEAARRWREEQGLPPRREPRAAESDPRSSAATAVLQRYMGAITDAGRSSRWQAALLALDSLRSSGIGCDLLAASAVVSACERAGQWTWAVKVLQELSAEGLKTDVVIFNKALSACARAAAWQPALELLSSSSCFCC
ncbi:unnamed protein product [Polarella glacialis]|uniref:Pentacotripeptide-repeat region of PRORP domain-containing protein n=1 Tax=Polarella glacialis TaxID=89957 RepID=A0A813KI45_POLGL|nr:unnamed protein product [Polarella glacialis]